MEVETLYLDHPFGALIDLVLLVAILSAGAWLRDWIRQGNTRSKGPGPRRGLAFDRGTMISASSSSRWATSDTHNLDSRSQRATAMMTPAQHRKWAQVLREKFPNDPEAPVLADHHEKIAAAIEAEQRGQ